MPSGVALSGWRAMAALFAALGAAIAAEDGSWWVVVGADYGVFVHDGTRRRAARPFLQRAIFRVARQWKPKGAKAVSIGNPTSGKATWAIMVGSEKLARQIAFAVEGEAKRAATEMGAVDTGNLRATIVAAPTVGEALAEAGRRALDSSRVLAA